MKIYIAGPISGKSYSEVVEKFYETEVLLRTYGYTVLNPLSGKAYLEGCENLSKLGEDVVGVPIASPHFIFERDKWMVSMSDIVYADLSESGNTVSIGTMMELAWSAMLGKHTITVCQKDNVHNHAFVREASDVVFETTREALVYLEQLLGSQQPWK